MNVATQRIQVISLRYISGINQFFHLARSEGYLSYNKKVRANFILLVLWVLDYREMNKTEYAHTFCYSVSNAHIIASASVITSSHFTLNCPDPQYRNKLNAFQYVCCLFGSETNIVHFSQIQYHNLKNICNMLNVLYMNIRQSSDRTAQKAICHFRYRFNARILSQWAERYQPTSFRQSLMLL